MGKRIAAIVFIYMVISLAWVALGGIMTSRSHTYHNRLSTQVAGLWGTRQMQQAPQLEFTWWTMKTVTEEVTDAKTKKTKYVKKSERVLNRLPVLLDASDIDVGFDLDHRKKGLLWYSTYGIDFNGDYGYVHAEDIPGYLNITYRFPSTQATYEDFKFSVDGQENAKVAPQQTSGSQSLAYQVPVQKGQRVAFSIGYKSRGLDDWRYTFGQDVNRVNQFNLAMTTNFDAIDFPDGSISPSTKSRTADGWDLNWNFTNLISGFDIGMDMPKKINPGPLAAQISLFAPVCLLFFFIWMFVITLLKKIDLHPMNYLFLGAAFFAFHLLFTYTVDRIPVTLAFVISSVVSVLLVVSYLRLAVGIRFAAVEAGLSQVVYLVLFSYAHFYKGWTGLIVTIGSILTLFFIMQLTGRINWTLAFAQSRGVLPAIPVEKKEV